MKFNKFEIITTTEVEELLAYNLNELGIDGVEIVNHTGLSDEDKERMFIDILPEERDDGISILRFFVEADESIEKYKSIIECELNRLSEFFNVGEKKIVISETDDSEWKDRWKEFFKPFYIDDLLITPTWIEPEKEEKYMIKIDPGSAFGTGLHETTRLCLRALKRYLKNGNTLLDIGCGSGILSIYAAKYGASEVVGIDIDENAVKVSEENFKINQLSKFNYQLFCGNIIEDRNIDEKIGYGKYDIIVANLLAEIVCLMAEKFIPHLKHDGVLITSGILSEKEDKVKETLKSVGFNSFEVIEDGEWVSIVAKR